MKPLRLAPSIERADWLNLEADIHQLEKAKADLLHIDIMDKTYGDTILFSPRIVAAVKKITKIPLDVHMYVRQPEAYFPELLNCLDDLDYINIEREAVDNLAKLMLLIREGGCRCAVSVDIATPLCMIEDIIRQFDMVNLMIRNAGCSISDLDESILQKIKRTRAMLDRSGNMAASVEVDGSIRYEDAQCLVDAGADTLVLGSKVVFRREHSFDENCQKLRNCILIHR